MQTEPKNLDKQQTPAATTRTPLPHPWVKPDFQQVPLNEALAGTMGNWDDITASFINNPLS